MRTSKHCFNRAAADYDANCQLQILVGKRLIDCMHHHQISPKQLLDLGCGTGLVTEILAQQFNPTILYALDQAPACTTIATKRLALFKATVLTEDFHTLSCTQRFDTIFSNMALHWTHSYQILFAAIRTQLTAQGYLIFSLPTHGTLHELQPHFGVREFASVAEVKNQLNQHNFQLSHVHTEVHTLTFPCTHAALTSLKKIGANFVTARKQKGLMGKVQFQKLAITELTYQITYFIARAESS